MRDGIPRQLLSLPVGIFQPVDLKGSEGAQRVPYRMLDTLYQPIIRCLGIAYQEQYQNHSDEWN